MSELNEKLIDYGGLEHFRDMLLNDSDTTSSSTWSSSKINEEIQAVGGTADSEFDGKTTEDFRFVTELPQEATEGEQVVIKGENVDTLHKYVSGAWAEQTPDANILYFDTENEALYSYVSAEKQFATISSVNTIVVGKNLNTSEALKAIKTPGTYSVLQRTSSTTKGEYTKKWTLTVEGIDYEEYELTDSVYQRMQSNYTIQKRTWSSTRTTNDGWSNFSTYYAGEIKDSTTSKYYTWSSQKISDELATNKGYVFDESVGGFATKYVNSDDENNVYVATNTASKSGAFAEGYNTTASGEWGTHAEGYKTTASGEISHAEGYSTTASGKYGSHAEGFQSVASGEVSHAEGNSTASSYYSHAEGQKTTASGNSSHSEGAYTTAQNITEHAEGYFNVSHKATSTSQYDGNAGNTQHSVGINQKNAFEIMQNGDMYVLGVGGYQGTNTKVQDATIKTLQGVITDINTSVASKQDALVAGNGISISGDTISCTVEPTPALEAGRNIEIVDNKINALGYKTPKNVEFSMDNGYFGGGFSEFSIHNPIESASMSFLQTLPSSMLPVTIKLSGAAGATSYVVNQDAWDFISQAGQMLVGYTFNTDKGSAKVSSIDTSSTSIVFESTINSTEALVEEEVVTLAMQNHIYISGSANTTTYSVSDDLGGVNNFLEFINSRRNLGAYTEISIDGYGVRMIVSANRQDSTITLMETLDKNNPIDNVEVLSFADDYYTYDNLAISYNSHAEGFGTSAGGEIFINPITYDSSTRKITTTQDLSQFLNAEGALKVFLPDNKSTVITINIVKNLGGGVYQLVPQNSADLEDGTYYGILNYGQFSHAEGRFTTASGGESHAEGSYTTASGVHSHAEGGATTASGNYSHAEGEDTTANNRAEHAEGSYNVSHKLIDYDWSVLDSMTSSGNTRHSIGIGYYLSGRPSVTVHKNALEVMQNGDMYLLGVGGYDGVHIKHETGYESVKTLQEYIASLEARIAALENPNT